MMEYVAKFTELANFVDDYVATNMAKVREWAKVFQPGQDCGIPPTEHGLYGQDDYGHKERDGGHTKHPICGC